MKGRDLEPPRVGARIRKYRLLKGSSLKELASAADLSTGILSLIERDQANPSLRTLTRIRIALGIPLSALFEDSPDPRTDDPDFVRRAGHRPHLNLGNNLVWKELLSSDALKELQFMILNIPAGGGSGDAPISYPAEKGGLVLEGEFILTVGEHEVRLLDGDSFQFDGSAPHAFRNESNKLARVLWIVSPNQNQNNF